MTLDADCTIGLSAGRLGVNDLRCLGLSSVFRDITPGEGYEFCEYSEDEKVQTYDAEDGQWKFWDPFGDHYVAFRRPIRAPGTPDVLSVIHEWLDTYVRKVAAPILESTLREEMQQDQVVRSLIDAADAVDDAVVGLPNSPQLQSAITNLRRAVNKAKAREIK